MNPEALIPVIKNQRRMWVEIGLGDMPPTVMVIRDNKVVLTTIAPQIDKMYGLRAAALCRDGLNADALVVILDAHVSEEEFPEGTTAEEAYRLHRERFPPGAMQKMCDEQEACEIGPGGEAPVISDALICQYHSADKHWMRSLLYKYDSSKSKASLEWTTVREYDQGTFEGGIFGTMQNILRSPKGMDTKGVQVMQQALKLTPEDTYIRLGRSAVQALVNMQYLVFIDPSHPELVPKQCNNQPFGMPQWYK